MGVNSYWYKGKLYRSFEKGWVARGVKARFAQAKGKLKAANSFLQNELKSHPNDDLPVNPNPEPAPEEKSE